MVLLRTVESNIARFKRSCEGTRVNLIKRWNSEGPLLLPLILDMKGLRYSSYGQIRIRPPSNLAIAIGSSPVTLPFCIGVFFLPNVI